MTRRFTQFFIILFNALLIIPCTVFSQEISDPESEYARIKAIAFEGNYDSAEQEAWKLVKSYPSYGDARILLGRILAWKKDYSKAKAVIDTLLSADPNNGDALSAKKDIMLWSKDNAHISTGIRAGYYFDSFREPYNRLWQIFKTGAEHRFSWGPAAGAINIGNLIYGDPIPFSVTEFQIEVEAYPNLSDKNYAYLAYAFSPGKYFPGHRAAVEVWQKLPAGWVVSAGLNYFYFDRSIFIASVSGEKYLGKYWFSLKGYVYFKDHGPTTSGYINARRYFNGNNFFQVTLGAGTAPDEPFDVLSDLMRLRAYSIKLTYNVSLTPKLMMRFGTGYSYEEFEDNIWRNRFEGNLSFIYAVKMK